MAGKARKRTSGGKRRKRDALGRFSEPSKKRSKKKRRAGAKAKSAASPRRKRRRTHPKGAVAMAKKRRRKSKEAAAPRRRRRARARVAAAAPRRRARRKARMGYEAASPRRRRVRRHRARAPKLTMKQLVKRVKRRPSHSRTKIKTGPRKGQSAGGTFLEPRRPRRRKSRKSAMAPRRYHRRSMKRGYSLENPLTGMEMVGAAVGMVIGYGVTDIVDRMVALMGGPKTQDGKTLRTPQQQAILVQGAPTLMRSLAQGGLAVAPWLGSAYVKNSGARMALQSFGLGAAVHLGGQLVKQGLVKLFVSKDSKPEDWWYQLYHDVSDQDSAATALLDAEKAAAKTGQAGLGALVARSISSATRMPTRSGEFLVPSSAAPPAEFAFTPGGSSVSASSPPPFTEYAQPPSTNIGPPVLTYAAPVSSSPVASAPFDPREYVPSAPTYSSTSPAVPPAMLTPGSPGMTPPAFASAPPGWAAPCQPGTTLKSMLNAAGQQFPVSSLNDAQMNRLTFRNAAADVSGGGCLSGFPPAGAFPE